MLRRFTTLTLLALLAGCQTLDATAGFNEVQSLVQDRTTHRIQWRTGSAEDEQAIKAVRELLGKELTAASAEQIALLNNRTLQATYEDLGIAQAAVVQAGLLKNPVFDLAVKFPSGGGSAALDIGIAQDFLDVLFIPMRTRIAAAQFDAVKLEITAKVLDIAGATRLAFLQVQADEQILELRRQIVSASEASYDFAKRLNAAGNLRSLDLSNEQASLAQSRLDLAAAEASLAENREKLTVLMGLWGDDTQWKIAKNLPELPGETLDLENVEKRAIARSIDLAVIQKRIDALSQELGFVRSTSLVQELEAGVVAERNEGQWETGPSIAVPLPLFDQGQAKVATAHAQLRREQETLAAQAVAIRSAARTARLRLTSAQQTVLFYRNEILPLREKIVKDTMLQYNAMQVSVFQLLVARAQQIDANRRQIEALHDYWRSRAQFDLLLAGRMSQSAPMARSAEPANTGGPAGH